MKDLEEAGHINGGIDGAPLVLRVALALCRLFINVCSMGPGFFFHSKGLMESFMHDYVFEWVE